MTIRYEDKLVEVSDQALVFRRYAFPFATARRVPWTQIASIAVRPRPLRNGSLRIWGTGDFRVWFPLDLKRPSRDAIFIATLRAASMQVGFTVEDTEKFSRVLDEMGMRIESAI